MSILLLILGALVALAATVSFFPIRKDPFTGTSFAIGWLTSELAAQLGPGIELTRAIRSSVAPRDNRQAALQLDGQQRAQGGPAVVHD